MKKKMLRFGHGPAVLTGEDLLRQRRAIARAERVQFIVFWFAVAVVAGLMFLTAGLQVWQAVQLERLIQAHDEHHAEMVNFQHEGTKSTKGHEGEER